MKLLLYIIVITLLTSCSLNLNVNKTKLKDIGSVTLHNSSEAFDQSEKKDTNSILVNNISLNELLSRRIYNNSSGTFFAILIDSTRNSYIEATIISHTDTNIDFHVLQTPLSKKTPFEFDISYNLSTLKKTLQKVNDDTYDFNFISTKSDTLKTFRIIKTKNFIVQKGILELLTGEIQTPNKNTLKFIAINDPHDVYEALTGLCFISVPNLTLLRIECKERAKDVKCPEGQKPISTVVPEDYFIGTKYYCQINCK